MRRGLVFVLVALLLAAFHPGSALAGAKLQINENASLDFGIRVQSLVYTQDQDLDGDGAWDTFTDSKIRRARFRLKAKIGDRVSAFLQTDAGSGSGGSGLDKRLIDAYVQIKVNQWVQFINGMNMAPILRQNLTSSGALMAADRPGVIYKSLSWGMRSRVGFTTATMAGTDSGLRGEADVRDVGVTLFGSGDIGDEAHLKYYAALNDGIPGTPSDTNRLTGRAQLNFFDAEPGYYNSSTYLGKKKTIGIGAAIDKQDGIGVDADGYNVDYTMLTADGFVEWPMGDGTFTAEGALIDLDLDNAVFTDGTDWREVQGNGFYVQAGYLAKKEWQPWVEYEKWTSDSDTDVGSYNALRVGLTYFIEGQNANVKVGYEKSKSEVPLTSGGEDTIGTFLVGTYITY